MDELKRYCAEYGELRALCERMGVAESTVWRWANGRTRPTRHMMKALAKATKGAVPVEAWS